MRLNQELMGNTQGATRRDRSDSGGKRFSEDEYPVQLKIPRNLGNNNSTPSMQYEDTCEYPIVIKVGRLICFVQQPS